MLSFHLPYLRGFIRVSRYRRPVAWCLLCAYGWLSSGLPLPDISQATRLPGAKRFLCEGHGCGCATAEQCWENCCCYSPEQHVAFARENGLAVPAALATAAREPATSSKEDTTCEHCRTENAAPEAQEMAPTGLIAMRALTCRGGPSDWLTAVVAIPVMPAESFAALEPGAMLPLTFDCRPPGWQSPPPTPPPRQHVGVI